jgi:putative acetyltransferase
VSQSQEVPLVVRSERAVDVAAIDAVTREAFANHPFSNQTEHLIVRSLRSAAALTVSLVAEAEGVVIGHAAASPVQVSGERLGWFGLGPVSVAPAFQRQGVGSKLVQATLAELHAKGAAGCVLLGDPAFYRRFGFIQHPSLHLPGAPAEHFMALAWRSPVPSGDVSYHAAFNAVA